MATLSTAAQNAGIAAIAALVDVDGPGDVVVRNGSGTVLATCVFSDPAFLAPSGGEVAADTIASDESPSTGTIADGLIRDGNGATVITLVTGTTSAADLQFNRLNIESGDEVAINSLTLTLPASPE